MTIIALHHVQLAMPVGQEDKARDFYAGILGLRERPKPEHLARRGGVWFSSGSAEIHLGVEPDIPAGKESASGLCRRRFAERGRQVCRGWLHRDAG